MSSAEDIISRTWAKLYNAPEHAEREKLKARVIELEAENRKLHKLADDAIADAGYWKRQATRNAP